MSDSEKSEKPAKATHTTLTRDASKCSVEACKRPYRAKGYCVTHYRRWRRGEIAGHTARYKICTKEACRKPRAQGSLCAEHAAKDQEGAAA